MQREAILTIAVLLFAVANHFLSHSLIHARGWDIERLNAGRRAVSEKPQMAANRLMLASTT
jgi:hypothetical protein